MSTQNRSSGGGRNQKKSNSGGGDTSNKRGDVGKTDKEKSQPKVLKPTLDQIRIAQAAEVNTVAEDPKMPEKVATLIEMTQRSEEEVCCALYECDNNLERAVVFLLETLPVGAFETLKKKKSRAANSASENAGEGDWADANANTDKREKSRNRSSTRGGRGGNDSRGWRGREARENERNLADSSGRGGGEGGYRGGNRGRGSSRGGSYVGRGGRGGRLGQRGMGRDQGSRSNYNSRHQDQDHQEVELWDNTIATNAEKQQQQQQQQQDDAWGDWDNEEYVGSLKDSKVFTTSNLQQSQTTAVVVGGSAELSAPPGLELHLGATQQQQQQQPPQQQSSHIGNDDMVQQYSSAVANNNSSVAVSGTGTLNPSQFPDIHSSNAGHNMRMSSLETQQMKSSSTLSAEQSQYFNSLTSQNAAAAAAAAAAAVAAAAVSQQAGNVNSYQNSSVQYPTSYATVFGDQNVSSQPAVRRARAKVPPPSKIPSTAVEMPGDTLNNIGYLDVQFGGLDFGTEDSFDALPEKFNSSATIDNQQIVQSQEVVSNDYQSKANSQQQAVLSAGLQNSQMVCIFLFSNYFVGNFFSIDNIYYLQSDSLTSGYSQRSSSNIQQQQNAGGVGSMNAQTNSSLDQLSKNDPYNQSNTSSTAGYQSSYNSSSSANKSSSYQPTATGQGYNSASYTNVQSSSASTYQPPSNNYNSYNQNSVNSYQQQANVSSVNNSSNSVAGSTVNSSVSTQNIPVGGSSSSTVNNASANSNAGYLSSQYQSNQTTSAYPSQQNAYQNNQSIYGGTGLSNNTGFTGSTSTSSSQYSNFSSAKLKDTSTTSSSSHYESVSSVAASTVVSSTVSSVVPSSTATTNSMSSPSLGLTNTKVTNSATNANKNSAGMVPQNIQMVSQYIQTGLPYYQQPVYSYEDLQMMQQRVPHVQGYYDLNYTPTSLGAAGVRDNLGSVAYSTMTDGRFARTDNNSSPVSNVSGVSSTMSQQAGSTAPLLNVPYAYFYGGNMMPGGFQYGTPAIYPQQIPAANTASGGQFPKPSYNTGYGSASYDALSQATQDYTKGAYPSSVNQQTKSQNVTNPPQAGTGSDITSSMYGKGHVALNKVNSYEKQNFHSGTPPPFNMPNTQTAGGTSAQPYGMYLQPMPTGHHNMIHQPIHQDSNSTGQRQQSSNPTKSATKQGYSPSYWAGQN
ncbi:protein lingerer isoform X4 [Episyrphus balteatus]|uniref:protein lingerer isoform X4 n=1 Tax=Episyrphus balteatus TaxID=286459 RepID=UPI002485EE08|nr:protein lingerer isoform X4 [Episyrphus balteatus]